MVVYSTMDGCDMGEEPPPPPSPTGTHSNVFESLHSTYTSLMHSSCSSLPKDWGQYISIMALSRYMRQTLVEDAQEEFLSAAFRQEYAREWLDQGIAGVPAKLAALSPLNALLAHQPWTITPEFMGELSEKGWTSQSELLHAILILAYFHSVSTFVIKKDVSLEDLISITEAPDDNFDKEAFENQSNQMLKYSSDPMARNRHLSCHALQIPTFKDYNQNILLYFKKIQSNGISSLCLEGDTTKDCTFKERAFTGAKKFVHDDLETQYIDFKPHKVQRVKDLQKSQLGCLFGASRYDNGDPSQNPKHKPYNTFYDFSWETEGYSLVSSLLLSTPCESSLADCIDNLLQSALNLDGFSQDFKSHVWSYVHVLYGIQFEDFDYTTVNKVLDLPLKVFIKTVACYPDRVTDKLIEDSLPKYKKSERMAINLIIATARMSVTLLYGLQAFYKHYSSSGTEM